MITSTSNARIKRLVNLKKKRKLRDEEGIFLVEEIRMFREVPIDKLKEVYVSESFYKKEKDTVKEVLKDSKIRVEELTDTVFAHASDTKTPQGILCVVEQMNHKISELTSAECPLIMVLDHLQDPGNLGNDSAYSRRRRCNRNSNGQGMRRYLQSENDPLDHGISIPYAVCIRGRSG